MCALVNSHFVYTARATLEGRRTVLGQIYDDEASLFAVCVLLVPVFYVQATLFLVC